MAKGAQDIKVDSDTKTVTVVFPTVEDAVTFRRKYNRYVKQVALPAQVLILFF